jgi:hypothetical protein
MIKAEVRCHKEALEFRQQLWNDCLLWLEAGLPNERRHHFQRLQCKQKNLLIGHHSVALGKSFQHVYPEPLGAVTSAKMSGYQASLVAFIPKFLHFPFPRTSLLKENDKDCSCLRCNSTMHSNTKF